MHRTDAARSDAIFRPTSDATGEQAASAAARPRRNCDAHAVRLIGPATSDRRCCHTARDGSVPVPAGFPFCRNRERSPLGEKPGCRRFVIMHGVEYPSRERLGSRT
jgi:hypothetical protein